MRLSFLVTFDNFVKIRKESTVICKCVDIPSVSSELIDNLLIAVTARHRLTTPLAVRDSKANKQCFRPTSLHFEYICIIR